MNSIKIPVNVECQRNRDYDCCFELAIPYCEQHDCSIDQIINDIVQFIEKKHKIIKFIPTTIVSDSFIGQQITYNDYDWKNCNVKVIDYPKEYVIQNGVHLFIDIAIYKHNVSASKFNNPICSSMTNDLNMLCPIY
eukprot:265346_1